MLTNKKAKSRKFFFRTLLFSALGWLVLQLAVYFLCRPAEWYWIYDIVKIKENLARQITGRKIVFVGGSATLFGVRTADIEKELQAPAVNYGVHASLELDYILHRAKKLLKPGDIVVLPLEYNLLLYEGGLSEIRTRFVLLFDPDYLRSLSFIERLHYLTTFSPLTVELSLEGWFWKLIGRPKSLRGYDVKTLNEHGDETSNLGNDLIKRKYKDIQPFPIQKDNFRETAGLKIIRDFNDWCLKNGITCFISYAPTIFYDAYHTDDYRNYFKKLENYFKEHHIKTIGSPDDFFYDKDYFYDTEYHLNSRGMTVHTEKMLSKIKDLLSDQVKN